MSLAISIFLSTIVLSLTALFIATKDRWNWKKIVLRVVMAITGFVILAGGSFYFYVYRDALSKQGESARSEQQQLTVSSPPVQEAEPSALPTIDDPRWEQVFALRTTPQWTPQDETDLQAAIRAGDVPARFLRKGEQEEAVRKRIANAKATAGRIVRVWEISSETDPASGTKVPRTASILSDDSLCQLQVEERMNGTRLAGIVCSGLKMETYPGIEVKFDNRPKSDKMRIEHFSDNRNIFIPSNQGEASYMGTPAYDEFLRRITEANKVALLLTFEGAGQHWMTFSLTGSGPALAKIGALDSKTRK